MDERTAEAYKQLTLRHKEAKSRAEQYIKTLVIGQKVNIVGGIYSGGQGKVVEVGPEGVKVDCGGKELSCFDRYGQSSKYTDYGDCWCIQGTEETATGMDTKKLVVGQKVYMESGGYSCEGKVAKVTPSGVEVQTADELLLWFDSNGKGRDQEGTHWFGPWYIVS